MKQQSDGLYKALGSKNDGVTLSELYDKYAPAIYGRILMVIHDKVEADKILERVFINVWKMRHENTGYLSNFTKLINEARNISYQTLTSR